MGDSHFKSNVKGFAGTETISNFASISGTALVGALTGTVAGAVTGDLTGNVDATTVDASSYIKIGTKYIIVTDQSTAASINAEATALVGTCPAGSVAFGAGELWLFSSDNSATTIVP